MKEIKKTIELTAIQKDILLATSQSTLSDLYHIQTIITLNESINVPLFTQCVYQLYRQYQHFSVALQLPEGEETFPSMRLNQVMTEELTVVDLSLLTDKEQQYRWQTMVGNDRQRPFDLYCPPLIRMQLVKLAKEDYRFIVTVHHLIFDGEAFVQLLVDLFSQYDGAIKGKLHPSPLPFHAYPQEKKNNTPASPLYFQELFSNYDEPDNFYLQGQQDTTLTQGVSAVTQCLAKHVGEQLKQTARSLAVTPNILFEVAWGLLLNKYHYANDIAFASIRRSPADKQLGVFINALPLRCQFSDSEQTVAKCIAIVKDQHRAFKPFRSTSIASLLRESGIHLNVKTAIDYKPIAPLQLLKRQGDKQAWRHRQANFETITHYDLFLEITNDSSVLQLKLNYRRDRFSTAAVSQFFSHYLTIVHAMISDVTKKISEINLLHDDAIAVSNSRYHTGENRALTYDNVMLSFSRQCQLYSERVAVVDSLSALSYHNVNNAITTLANVLRTQYGVSASDSVIVIIDRNHRLLIALLAILKLGANYIPLDTHIPSQRLTHILNETQAAYLLVDNVTALTTIGNDACVINIEKINLQKKRNANHFFSYSKEQLAYVIFTSGSTGKPKGVRIQHLALQNLLESVQKQLALTENDTLLAITSIGFDISALELFLPLICGAKVVVADNEQRNDPFQLMQLIEQHQITVMQATPSLWQMLLDAGWKHDKGMKLLCGGEPLNKTTAAQLLAQGNGFWHCYGPTETTIWSAISRVDNLDDVDAWLPIGEPIANTRLAILDKQQRLLPTGVVGEIYIGGNGLAVGYTDAELTRRCFAKHAIGGLPAERYYQTGDLACWREDGLLAFKGRVDDQVKIKGYRIEIGEIESVLCDVKDINYCAVVPVKQERIQFLAAFIEGEEQALTVAQLKKQLSEKLPDYMIPATIQFLKILPRSLSGKINRKKLQQFAVGKSPSNRIEKTTIETLLSIYAEILQCPRDQVTKTSDFFSLGGDSLMALSLVMKIERHFGVRLTLQDVRGHSQAVALVKCIHQTESKTDVPIAMQGLSSKDSVPLTDFQQRMWTMDKFYHTTAYNLGVLLLLDGNVDPKLLEKSLQILINRQQGLCISFIEKESRAEQVLLDIDVKQIFHFTETNETAAVVESQRLQQLANHKFSLTGEPLWLVELIKLVDGQFYLAINAHHIIVDEWSVAILLSEVSVIYHAISQHKIPDLPIIDRHYFDYLQHYHLNSDKAENETQSRVFWQQYLSGFNPLKLPYDYPKPTVQRFSGKTLNLAITHQLSIKIQSYIKRNKLTMTSFWLSALNLLFYCCTGNKDLVIGLPFTLRRHADAEHRIGAFVNTLPVRVQAADDFSISRLLDAVRDNLGVVDKHSQFPFKKIIEQLSLPFDVSENPVFQVFLAVQQNYFTQLTLPDVTVAEAVMPKGKAKFNLSFYFTDYENIIDGTVEFRADLFKTATIHTLNTLLLTIAEKIVSKEKTNLQTIRAEMQREQQAYFGEMNVLPVMNNNDLRPLSTTPLIKRDKVAMDFSLFFFPATPLSPKDDPYALYFDAATFADNHGFTAVWTPERHFDAVGEQFPNPALLNAALAKATKNLALRAGSVVSPLHHPTRIVENWAVLDHLSGGRVGVALASGWHPQDFVLNPTGYKERKQVLIESVDVIRRLWSGDSVPFSDGNDELRNITTYPKPLRDTLPLWITAAENPETFVLAGKLGCNLFTHLLGQDLTTLASKIALYRKALTENGFDSNEKTVTLAVHTYLHQDEATATHTATPYLTNYLQSHLSLLAKIDKANNAQLDALTDDDRELLVARSVQRFLTHYALIGSVETCLARVNDIYATGVNEIACLIDFGIPSIKVMQGLQVLEQLKTRATIALGRGRIVEGVRSQEKPMCRKILRPTTTEEKQLLAIIEKLYKVDSVNMQDNLPSLGGNSLIAVQLISAVENCFSVKLSIRDVLEVENIAALAKQILCDSRKNKPVMKAIDDPIVTLKKGSSELALFLIHPVGGTVYCYRPLVNHLPDDLSVYGIQDPGVVTQKKLFNHFEQMVECYVEAICRTVSSKTVCLAGASLGGTLALEIGVQLIKRGYHCPFIGLFDTWAIFPEDLKKKTYFEENMRRQHTIMEKLFDDYAVNDAADWLALQWHRQTLLMQYQPHKIEKVNVTLFKAVELLPEYQTINEPTNYWDEYLVTAVNVEQIPGNHETIFLEPNVAVLGAKVSAVIQAFTHEERASLSG